jgi:serine/threonine protein kinase
MQRPWQRFDGSRLARRGGDALDVAARSVIDCDGPTMRGAPSDPRLPTTVAGRYEVVRVLGRGGMGVVYEAIHAWTGRRVALKVLRAEFAGDDAALQRFQREARAGVQSAHPHIVEVLDMGQDADAGTLYLAQELLEGEDLAARLSRLGRLSLREAAEALIPAMNALEAAHLAGVVHRDVKPANLFLARAARGGEVTKVIDFGVASVADSAAVTRTGAPLGTPQYMAPEQARGERDLDARADVWAMGAVWFECLTGRRPIDGANYHEVLSRLLLSPCVRFEVDDPVSEGLRAPIERALTADRAARFPSMAAFAQAVLAAPEVAGAAWGERLAAQHPFNDLAPVPPRVMPASIAPSTLDLPPSIPSVDASLPSAELAASKPDARPAARASHRAWLAPVALGALLLVGVASWLRGPAPTAVVKPTPTSAPRADTAVDGATALHEPPRAAPNPPMPRVVADAGGAGPTTQLARPASPRAPAVRVRRAPTGSPASIEEPAVNGAPVLEP